MLYNQLKRAAAASACFMALALPAMADNLQRSLTTNSQAWVGNSAQAIRLNDAALLSIPFTNPLGGIVSVTYTAECQLVAGTTSWLFVTILIDNVPVAPTGFDAAFCSGRGAGVQGGLSRNSITVSRSLVAGAYSLRVTAQVNGAHTGARLDDTTLLIER